MTTKHTPGPWTIEIRTTQENHCAPGIWIRCATGTVVDTGNLSVWPLSEADARLIAAAPDMLEALIARKAAREFAAQVSAATPDGQKIAPHLMAKAEQLFAKAEALEAAAIAKAEGRTYAA